MDAKQIKAFIRDYKQLALGFRARGNTKDYAFCMEKVAIYRDMLSNISSSQTELTIHKM